MARLPEGTRISIEVPAGSMAPFNRFCREAMRFRPQPDAGALWCDEHPEPPSAREDDFGLGED